MEEKNNFDEIAVKAIFALNDLMQTREVAKQTKAVTKINRFKVWVMQLQDEMAYDHTVSRETEDNDNI